MTEDHKRFLCNIVRVHRRTMRSQHAGQPFRWDNAPVDQRPVPQVQGIARNVISGTRRERQLLIVPSTVFVRLS
jgi:hypothetical protein